MHKYSSGGGGGDGGSSRRAAAGRQAAAHQRRAGRRGSLTRPAAPRPPAGALQHPLQLPRGVGRGVAALGTGGPHVVAECGLVLLVLLRVLRVLERAEATTRLLLLPLAARRAVLGERRGSLLVLVLGLGLLGHLLHRGLAAPLVQTRHAAAAADAAARHCASRRSSSRPRLPQRLGLPHLVEPQDGAGSLLAATRGTGTARSPEAERALHATARRHGRRRGRLLQRLGRHGGGHCRGHRRRHLRVG